MYYEWRHDVRNDRRKYDSLSKRTIYVQRRMYFKWDGMRWKREYVRNDRHFNRHLNRYFDMFILPALVRVKENVR